MNPSEVIAQMKEDARYKSYFRSTPITLEEVVMWYQLASDSDRQQFLLRSLNVYDGLEDQTA